LTRKLIVPATLSINGHFQFKPGSATRRNFPAARHRRLPAVTDRAAAGEAGIGKSRARPRRSETHWRRGQARRRALAAPQLSADFVAEVGDQKGDAAEAISSSRPLPSARLGAAALTQWH